MPKVHLLAGSYGMYLFYCPGCKQYHSYYTKPNPTGHIWSFNGDVHSPTFMPSLLVNGHYPESRCHIYLRSGMIQFLPDCFHDLAGLTVECPPYED